VSILFLHVRGEHGALGPEPIFTGAFVVIAREADRALVSLVGLFRRGGSLMLRDEGEIYTVRGLQLEGAGALVVIASEADRAGHFELMIYQAYV
jgi:hypothetical protein